MLTPTNSMLVPSPRVPTISPLRPQGGAVGDRPQDLGPKIGELAEQSHEVPTDLLPTGHRLAPARRGFVVIVDREAIDGAIDVTLVHCRDPALRNRVRLTDQRHSRPPS